jgi:hypothetical protein
VLVIIAVVFLISAVGQAILQALVGDNSVVVTAVLSVLGSVFLACRNYRRIPTRPLSNQPRSPMRWKRRPASSQLRRYGGGLQHHL